MIKISALILLIPFVTFGQIDKRGLLLPKDESLQNSDQYCCILSPSEGFSVYDQPKGKVIGILKRSGDAKKDDQVPYKIYLISGKRKTQIDHYREIGYEISAINYTDASDGFVKVLDPSESYWLNVSEINKKAFKIVNWMEHLINQSADVLGYYAKDSGLNLRKEPNAKSDIIGSVRGELFEIKLTHQTSGQWCKVKITKHKEHPCETDLNEKENKEYQSEGWLKIIDDNGEPNIFHHTRGC